MPKKCIICGDEAVYRIKDTSDFYCTDCAVENFSDIDLLQKVEETVKKVKEDIEKRTSDDEADEKQD